MQDSVLHNLLKAYMFDEIGFDEYRRQRSEYIDNATGYETGDGDHKESTETNIENPVADTKTKTTRKMTVILLISLAATLTLAIYTLFKLTGN